MWRRFKVKRLIDYVDWVGIRPFETGSDRKNRSKVAIIIVIHLLLFSFSQCYLPFQSIYMTAMDREIDNSNSAQSTTSLLTGHKFLEV